MAIGLAIAAVAIIALIVLVLVKSRKWQASKREEILAYFAEHAPDLKVSQVSEDELRISDGTSEGDPFYLHNVYRQLARVRTGDVEGHNSVYQIMVDTVRESHLARVIVPERDLPLVFPRIMEDATIESMRAQTSATIPSHPLGVGGLSVVFVLNRAVSVQYVNDETLEELGLTIEDALELAKKNLRATWSCEGVRGAVEHGNLAMLKSMDTFDAARLLLVPECLHNRESIVALIPDRDTLALIRPPDDGDWEPIKKLARSAAGQPLCPRPILVTNAGFRFSD